MFCWYTFNMCAEAKRTSRQSVCYNAFILVHNLNILFFLSEIFH